MGNTTSVDVSDTGTALKRDNPLRLSAERAEHGLRVVPHIRAGTLSVACQDKNHLSLLIKFKLDASVPCRVTTFFFASESQKDGTIDTQCDILPGAPVHYGPGVEQEFPPKDAQPNQQHRIKISNMSIKHLRQTGDTYPLVIRIESLSNRLPAYNYDVTNLPLGSQLPRGVNAHTTFARLMFRPEGSWDIAVLGQRLWLDGNAYELPSVPVVPLLPAQPKPAETATASAPTTATAPTAASAGAADSTAAPSAAAAPTAAAPVTSVDSAAKQTQTDLPADPLAPTVPPPTSTKSIYPSTQPTRNVSAEIEALLKAAAAGSPWAAVAASAKPTTKPITKTVKRPATKTAYRTVKAHKSSHRSSGKTASSSATPAAATSTADAKSASSAAAAAACAVCHLRPVSVMAAPCRHACMCIGCALQQRAQYNRCPVCQLEMQALVPVRGTGGPQVGATAA